MAAPVLFFFIRNRLKQEGDDAVSVNENRKVISNIMLGIMISVLTGMVLIGAAAKLLISGSVGEGGTEWLILGTLFIASALGSAFPVFIRYD